MKLKAMLAALFFAFGCGGGSSNDSHHSAPDPGACGGIVQYVMDGETVTASGFDHHRTNTTNCMWYQEFIWECAVYEGFGCVRATLIFQNDCEGAGWYFVGDLIEDPFCNW